MSIMKRLIVSVILIFIISLSAFGVDVLTLSEYLEIITEKIPQIRQNLIKEEMAELNIIKADSYRDLSLSAGASWNGVNGYSGYDYSNGLSLFAKLKKTLPATGAVLSTGIEYDFLSMETNGNSVHRFAPALTVDVTQPLMKNYLGKLDKIPLLKSKLASQIQKLQTDDALTALRTDFTKLYYRWASLENALQLLEKRIENALLMEEEVQRRYRNNLADADEVYQSHSTVLTYREGYVQTERSVQQLKKELAPYIDLSHVRPDVALFESLWQKAAEHEFVITPFEETRHYLMLATTLEQAGLDITLSRELTKPDLNLSAGLTFRTQEEAFSDSYKVDDLDYRVSLTLSFPLGNRAAKAGLSLSQLDYEYAGLEIDKAALSHQKALGQLSAQFGGNCRLLELRRENLETLRSQYEAQRRKYNQARLELNSLIQTDNQITGELIQINDLKYNLIEAYLQHLYLTGQSQ